MVAIAPEASLPTAASSKRKPRAPQASTSQHRQSTHRRPAPLPSRPSSSSQPANATSASLPLKTVQGARTQRTDSTKDGWERDVVFVTRNTPLGALMGRCRNLIMSEGYTRIRLHAMAAAIPHAILLLHALLDILPYPQGSNGMWYEIRTGTVECIDEVKPQDSRRGKGKEKADAAGDVLMDDHELDLGSIGAVEEDEPTMQARLKSTIEIDLHIGPKRSNPLPGKEGPKPIPGPPKLKKRNRPSKRQRRMTKAGQTAAGTAGDDGEDDEEAMMNEMNGEVVSAKTAGNSSGKQGQAKASVPALDSRRSAGPLAGDDDEEEEEEEEVENR